MNTKIYDERDDFDIVNVPFLDSDFPRFGILWCLYFSTYSICSNF